ncbi:hypothetical protein AVEN_198591-1 [Araneus ventricosus]|uniref:Uncharacterized protein n=1 Tax=Araneus ventricosus TaxID=182803 RepID=A0A4Y2VSE6_ARAVE|nr:hypothetical protein AVEN_198591-1 [Araneus ventricosus]
MGQTRKGLSWFLSYLMSPLLYSLPQGHCTLEEERLADVMLLYNGWVYAACRLTVLLVQYSTLGGWLLSRYAGSANRIIWDIMPLLLALHGAV